MSVGFTGAGSKWLDWRHVPLSAWLWVVFGLPAATLALAVLLGIPALIWEYVAWPRPPAGPVSAYVLFVLVTTLITTLAQVYAYPLFVFVEIIMLLRLRRFSLTVMLLVSPVLAGATTVGMVNPALRDFNFGFETFADTATPGTFLACWIWIIFICVCVWLPLRRVVLQSGNVDHKSVTA